MVQVFLLKHVPLHTINLNAMDLHDSIPLHSPASISHLSPSFLSHQNWSQVITNSCRRRPHTQPVLSASWITFQPYEPSSDVLFLSLNQHPQLRHNRVPYSCGISIPLCALVSLLHAYLSPLNATPLARRNHYHPEQQPMKEFSQYRLSWTLTWYQQKRVCDLKIYLSDDHAFCSTIPYLF